MTKTKFTPAVDGLSEGEVRALAKADIRFYAMLIKDEAGVPEFKFDAPIAAIADQLQYMGNGLLKRLMVSIMPQFGKTTIAADIFFTWLLGRNPRKRYTYATYSAQLAEDRGSTLLRIMNSELYRWLFPETVLDPNSQSKSKFMTTVGGGVRCIGRGQGLTGFRTDGILLDDTLKDQDEADSEAVRKELHNWYTTVVMTRIKEDGPLENHDWLMHIGTRWHVDDLIGWAQRNQAAHNWKILKFSALDENDQSFCPARKSSDFLRRVRASLPPRQWGALYQQNPVPSDGTIYNLAVCPRYSEANQPPTFDYIVQSWDTAQKAKEANDPSVCTTWGIAGADAFLIDVFRKRLGYPDLKKAVLNKAAYWAADVVLIEDKSSGTSLIQDLAQEDMPCAIQPITPTTSKEMRAITGADVVEGGRIWLPLAASWLSDYEYELSCFPVVVNDDQVDSTSQFIAWFKERLRKAAIAWVAGNTRISKRSITNDLRVA